MAAGYSRNKEAAEAFRSDFTEAFGARSAITLHSGNVGSADDCRRVVAEVLDQQGRIDILVNNAGITIDKTHAKLTDDDWHKVLAVNLSGAFFLAQAVLPHMIERGSGRIVNVSSVIGEIGNIGQATTRPPSQAYSGSPRRSPRKLLSCWNVQESSPTTGWPSR